MCISVGVDEVDGQQFAVALDPEAPPSFNITFPSDDVDVSEDTPLTN